MKWKQQFIYPLLVLNAVFCKKKITRNMYDYYWSSKETDTKTEGKEQRSRRK